MEPADIPDNVDQNAVQILDEGTPDDPRPLIRFWLDVDVVERMKRVPDWENKLRDGFTAWVRSGQGL
jgi:thymidylate kinase